MAGKWNEEETLMALSLYLQTPYGKIHDSNPEIIALSKLIGRSPGAVGMKMLNLAAHNPQVIKSGRVGLKHGSKLDKEIWNKYAHDWKTLDEILSRFSAEVSIAESNSPHVTNILDKEIVARESPTTIEGTSKQRRGQGTFRRLVMANYGEKCCITGIAEPKLLIASHIKPWEVSDKHRLNPENGLALSATFDKAFDKGLLTINQSLQVIISEKLLKHKSAETRMQFEPFQGRTIAAAERYAPDPDFIDWHNEFFDRQH